MAEANITSTTSGNFSDDATWVGGVAPATAQHAIIANGHNVTINADDEVKSLTVNATGTLTGNASYSITVNGEGDASFGTNGYAVKITGEMGANVKIICTTAGGTQVDLNQSAGSQMSHFTVSKSDGGDEVRYDANTSFDNLTVTAGTFQQATPGGSTMHLTINHDVLISGGTLSANGGNINMSFGSLTINNGATYSATSGTTTITGGYTTGTLGEGSNPLIFYNKTGGTFIHNGGTLLDMVGKNHKWFNTGYGNFYNLTMNHATKYDIYLASADSSLNGTPVVFEGDVLINKGGFRGNGNEQGGTVLGNFTLTGSGAVFDGRQGNWSFGSITTGASSEFYPTSNKITVTGGLRESDFAGTLYELGAYPLLGGPTWVIGGTGGNFEGDFIKNSKGLSINQDAVLNFDGTNDYINVANHASLQIGGANAALTLSCWLKRDAASGAERVFGRYANYDYALEFDGANKPCFTIMGDTAHAANNAITDTNWHHIAATFDDAVSSGTIKLYVDGILDRTITSVGTITTASTDFRISDSGASAFDGNIVDVRVYDTALELADVQKLSSKMNVGVGSPVGWYKLNEGTGTSAADSSSNSNTGTITNFAMTGTSSNWLSDAFGVDIQDNTTTVSNLIVESGQLNTKGLTYLDAFEGSGGTLRDVTISSNILDYAAGDPYTLAFWYKYASGNHGSQGTIISTQTHGGDNGFRMGYNNANFILRNGNSERNNTTTVNSAGWYHVIYTRNTDGTGEWYLNGVNDGDITGFGVDCSTGAESSTGIGRKIAETGGGTTRYLAGSLRDLRIYDNHISADIAASIYRGSYNVTPTHWYKMSDDTGATGAVVDSGTATAANGTGTGLSWANGSLKVNGAARVLTNGSVS